MGATVIWMLIDAFQLYSGALCVSVCAHVNAPTPLQPPDTQTHGQDREKESEGDGVNKHQRNGVDFGAE